MSPSEELADGPWVGIMGCGDESLSSETGFWESCVYIWTGIADAATGGESILGYPPMCQCRNQSPRMFISKIALFSPQVLTCHMSNLVSTLTPSMQKAYS